MNVAIDLDGTLAHWLHPTAHAEVGANVAVGDWIDGAREAVARLLVGGHRVVVHSCRATWPEGGGADAVCEFVRSGGFAPVRIVGRGEPAELGRQHDSLMPRLLVSRYGLEPSPFEPFEVGVWVGRGKPIAHWYVDDRAVPFDELAGWDATLARIAVATGASIPA